MVWVWCVLYGVGVVVAWALLSRELFGYMEPKSHGDAAAAALVAFCLAVVWPPVALFYAAGRLARWAWE